ncbi:DnaD domain protein [Paenalkalicoccus suaedae]|uniref:DnaD domain protein n=1 Tax=Paenalkalicoccus suaedae TaxID=2592382 RepID=A0A859FFW0_9BACI|nr:DnaD domain protein [Paenalkalicoccus suaedae]QKS72019.1 DnaD domain protein [Paenalkalicoccus suaedae]
MQHWKEILPSHHYVAYTHDKAYMIDYEVLTLLYQPLIGSVAFSLYMTLLADVQKQAGKQIKRSHKHLMLYTGQPLNILFEERKKLEAIRLLNVYRKQVEEEYEYYYELLPPMSPKEFFQDDFYSVFLYNRLGSKENYLELRSHFYQEEPNKEGFEDVTTAFDAAFSSIHPSELQASSPEMKEILTSNQTFRGRSNERESQQFSKTIGEVIEELPSYVNKKSVSEQAETIEQYMFLYQYSAKDMAFAIQEAMLHTDELDMKELQKIAKRKYYVTEGQTPPMLGLRQQPHVLRTNSGQESEEDGMIHYFETTSPLEYLHSLSGGAKLSEGDISIVERLIAEYKLPPGVVNVLVDYLFTVDDKKLSKNLAFKIAGHWKRKKIDRVADAMELARKEYEDRKNFSQKGAPKKAQVKTELVPKWMEAEDTTNKQAASTSNTNTEEPVGNDKELLEQRQKAALLREQLKEKKRRREEG